MLLAVMLFAYLKSNAQTEPMYSQYMFNMLGVNPAYAGSREASSFNFFQRSQWIELQGAPQTTSFSFDQSILNKRAGWGIQFYDDKIGVEKADGINIMGFLTSGIVILINEDLKLKPSTMIKMVEGAPIEADLNTNIWLRDIIGLGVSYRTGDAVIGMAEIQANQNLRFGYAYDMTISPLKFYNTGTHEIMIRYEIGNFKNKIKSTRYF